MSRFVIGWKFTSLRCKVLYCLNIQLMHVQRVIEYLASLNTWDLWIALYFFLVFLTFRKTYIRLHNWWRKCPYTTGHTQVKQMFNGLLYKRDRMSVLQWTKIIALKIEVEVVLPHILVGIWRCLWLLLKPPLHHKISCICLRLYIIISLMARIP